MGFSKCSTAFVAFGLLGLAGVARADDDQWQSVTYNCGTGSALTVLFKSGGSSVRVQAADKDEVRLVAREASTGSRYGDSRHELRVNGDQATWQLDQKKPLSCTALNGNVPRLAGADSN